MKKILSQFTKADRILWLSSVSLVILFFLIFDRVGFLTLVASLIGVTSLIFNAKGNPIGQILMILFSILYGIISYSFAYYGEMVTYLGMTGPKHSVLGIRPDLSISKFRGDLYQRYQWSNGPTKMEAVLFTIDSETGICRKAERVDLYDENPSQR